MNDSREHGTLPRRTPSSTHAGLQHIDVRNHFLKSMIRIGKSSIFGEDGSSSARTWRNTLCLHVCASYRSWLWLLVLAQRRVTQSVLKSNTPKAIVSCFTRDSNRKRFTTTGIQVLPATVRCVVTFVISPLQLYERMNRLLTRLEEVELVLTDRYYFPKPLQLDSANASPVSSENINDPFESRATASQIFRAALADNKTLDHLLASFDDQRVLRNGGERQEENGKVTQLWPVDQVIEAYQHKASNVRLDLSILILSEALRVTIVMEKGTTEQTAGQTTIYHFHGVLWHRAESQEVKYPGGESTLHPEAVNFAGCN